MIRETISGHMMNGGDAMSNANVYVPLHCHTDFSILICS